MGGIVADCKHYDICKLPASHGEYCILHSPDQKKDIQEFNTALKEHRLNKKNYSFFNFPSTFPPLELISPHDNELFAPIKAKFDNAVFHGTVNFKNITIRSCSFFKATFKNNTSFLKTNFKGNTTFSSAIFEKHTDFSIINFNGSALFNNAKFYDNLFFNDVTFHNIASFNSSRMGCRNSHALIEFKKVTFDNDTTFHDAKAIGRLNMIDTTFNGSTIFWDFFTKRICEFCTCFFKGEPTEFDGSKFIGEKTRLFRCRFYHGASFKKVKFRNIVTFENTDFYDGISFVDTAFNGKAIFQDTTFKGYSLFEGTEKPIFENANVVFKGVILDPPETLNIRNADFKNTTLTQLNLEKASLTAITWPKKGLFISRNCIYDEKINENPSQVERLYRELKRNFEEKKDWTRAGDFHYGEKEMRKKSAESFGLKFILWLHRTFGAYGERASIPAFWLAILFLICSMLYAKFGLAINDSSRLAQASVIDCFRYSLETLFFLKPADLVPIGYSIWVRTFESILGPVFIALTAWSVRQQLRR
jgi:uncharacterized protein YjbI with pentapeptide repeats